MAAFDPSRLLEHADSLRALARSLVFEEADDIVQQTWLAALERPPRDDSRIGAWLGTVARHLAWKSRRGGRRRLARERAAARPEGVPGAADASARLEMERRIVDAVRDLGEPYRTTVILRYFDDLGPEEIARRTGVPVETVRTRLRRALLRLRTRLDSEHGGDRGAWCAALLPIVRPKGGGAVLAGATLMSAKTLTITAAAAAAAAFLLFLLASGSGGAAERPRATRDEAGGVLAAAERGSPDSPPAAREEEAPAPSRLALRGTVVDSSGNPVAGAEVRIRYREISSLSGPDGRFALPVTSAGTATVVAKGEGYAPGTALLDPLAAEPQVIVLERGARLRVRVLTPSRDPAAGASVKVLVRSESGVAGLWSQVQVDPLTEGSTDAGGIADFAGVPSGRIVLRVDDPRFAPAEALLDIADPGTVEREILLSRGATIAGRVLGPDGRPLENARVHASGHEERFARSDREGAYRLERVKEGEVELVASAEGFGPGTFGSCAGWDVPVGLAVRSGQLLSGIDIQLTEAAFVVGRVVDEAASPITGVEVGSWIRSPQSQVVPAVTGEDGRFRLGPIARTGAVGISVWFRCDGRLLEGIESRVDGPLKDLGDIVALPLARIRGTVVDAEGRPVPGAKVSLLPGEAALLSGPGGAFEFPGVVPGRLLLSAAAQGLRSDAVAVETESGATLEGVELKLRPALDIEGTVTAGEGRPREGLRLALALPSDPARGMETAVTDSDGRFRFREVVEGEYLLGVAVPTFVVGASTPGAIPLELTPAPMRVRAGESGLRLTVPFGGPVAEGSVVDEATGSPIRAFSANFLHYRWFVIDSFEGHSIRAGDGRFRVDLSEEGGWAVEIRAPGYALQRTAVKQGEAGAPLDFGTIRLGGGGTLAGTVRDVQGAPVPFARIHILSPTMQVMDETPFTDADGSFSLSAIAPGTYNVFAVSPHHTLGIARSIRVEAEKLARVELTLPAAVALEILVRDGNGAPVEGAEVTYSFAAVQPLTSKMFRGYEPPGWGGYETGPDGRIRKQGLPEGPLALTVEKEGFAADSRTVDLKPGEPMRLEVVLRRE